MKIILRYFLVLLLLPLSLDAQESELYFTEFPNLSPDGQTIYFTYNHHIWSVEAKGGVAQLVMGSEGDQTRPKVSPDGKWLAFSSNQYGNYDLFLLPLGGGEVKQLTFHQAADLASSWSWDSQWIYFTSSRYNSTSTYKVNINGGTPQRVFEHYFNTVHDLFPDPVTGELYFNYSWESMRFATRKGYKGPFNSEIQSYNPKTKAYKKYTDWEGKDFNVTIDREGHLYFISDQDNGQSNLYTFEKNQKIPLTNFEEMVMNPSVNADGGKVVFEKGYELWLYDVSSKSAKKISIHGLRERTIAHDQGFKLKGNISNFEISPDDKKIAMVSRGKLFVSDAKGKFIKEIPTKQNERVMSVHWLNDNKTLLYSQTSKGYLNWFKQAADGTSDEVQLTHDAANNRAMSFDPEKKQAVYLRGRNDIMVMDLATFHTKKVATGELWGFQNDDPSFTPDGKYVIYSVRENFEKDIMLCRLADQKTFNLTQSGISESTPVPSIDGKYIYFVSDRTNPSYPHGTKNAHIYRIPLYPSDSPFRSQKFDSLFTDKAEPQPLPTLHLKKEGIIDRIEKIGPDFGQQNQLFVRQNKEKDVLYFLSDHQGGENALFKLTKEPFEKEKIEKIELPSSPSRGIQLSQNKDNLYVLNKGNLFKVDHSSKVTKIALTDFSFSKNLEQEFLQMYEEVWANLEENYYNENFNGVNWKEVRDRYAGYLKYIQSRSDLRRLLQDMMGELNTSHYGFNSSGKEEATFYKTYTAEPGISFSNEQPYTVDHVVPYGPADYPAKNIRAGDQLIAVNGRTVDPSQNRNKYFTFPELPSELNLSFKRGGTTYEVNIHPENSAQLKTQLYDSWISDNARKVGSKGKKRIGYVHMKNMSMGALQKFREEMVLDSINNREGLILDLRYNTGGNVHDDVLNFISQRLYINWKYREGSLSSQPNFHPGSKPIVILVNQQTLSDGEMVTAGFQALKLGTVIGTGTYRWIIFTTSKFLVDGSSYRLPSWGIYTLDGKDLEKTGVTPDIYVDTTFKDRLTDDDPQLEEAIQFILNQLQQ